MAVYTTLEPNDVDAIARAFGLGRVLEAKPIARGSVNTNYEFRCEDKSYFVRLYEEQGQEGAAFEWAVGDRLASAGVPCARRVPPVRTGVVLVASRVVGVFEYVAGDMVCQKSVRPAHVRSVGGALADSHRALKSTPARRGRFEVADIRARLGTVPRGGAFDDARADLESALDSWDALVASTPRTTIHGDLFRDNVLFGPEGELRALLDWESAAIGDPIFDLAVTLLAWTYGDTFDDSLVGALLEGYAERGELHADDLSRIWEFAVAAAARFAVTRITDYAMRPASSVRVEKDWRRFWDRLRAARARV